MEYWADLFNKKLISNRKKELKIKMKYLADFQTFNNEI